MNPLDKNGLVKTGEYTAVNPQFQAPVNPRVAAINAQISSSPLASQGISQAPSAFNTNQPITSSVLNSGESPITLPETKPSTISAGISGASTALLEMDKLKQEALLKTQEQQAKLAETESKQTSILERIGLAKKEQTTKGREEFGLDTLEPTRRKALQDLKTSQVRELAELKALEGQNLTGAGAQAAQAGIRQKYGIEQLESQLSYHLANDDIVAAEKTINDRIALETEPLYAQLDLTKNVYDQISDSLTKSEDRMWALKIGEVENQIAEKNKIGEFAKQVAANGADAATISRVSNAKTMAEAIQASGQYAGDVTERLYKQEQLNNARLQGQKLAQEIEQGKPLTGEFAGVINSASGLVPNTKRATTKTNIANAVASENYVTAYAEVANAVSDGLTGTNKTTFDDARTDIGVMVGMRQAIKEYTDAGGDTGFLKGSADSIAKKFGQLATDPKFAALGVQLTREFQAYRNAMTGAAFTPEESREYAAVNPRTNANLDLNLATIDGALNQLTNRVTSTVNARIPDAQKIYDLAFTKSDVSEAQTPVGDVQYVGGVKHIKAQDGLYYPETKPQTSQTTTAPSINPSYQSLNSNQFSGMGSFFNFK